MAYPFQITSMDQYEMAYRVSVNQPEEFWESVAENFKWRKKCLLRHFQTRGFV